MIEQNKEENVFNEADDYIKAMTNKKPEFKYIEVIKMTATTASIKVAAIDGDGENLTYKLFYGLDKDNLEEKDKKENIEQGAEVQFEMTGIDITKVYYYRIDVSDKYAIVPSQVSTLMNKKPVIEKVQIKNVTRTGANVVIQGTDEDVGDKLIYKIYYGTDKDSLETKGKAVEKGDIVSGKEETLEIKDLKPGTKYYYKIAITDGKQTVYTEIKDLTTVVNNAPAAPTVAQANTQQNSFTITAKATDPEGDKLTYKLYTGTSKTSQTTLKYTSPEASSRNDSYNFKYKYNIKYRIILSC